MSFAFPTFRSLAYAPLLPIALAASIGLVADRYLFIPIPLCLGASLLCIIAWMICRQRKREQLALLYLWTCWAGMAAAYHHAVRNVYPPDDIGEFAKEEPALVHLRGTLSEEPVIAHRRQNDPLVSQPRTDATNSVLEIDEIERNGTWKPASGLAQMRVEGKLDGLHLGDSVEVTGWLARPLPPMNPGEMDYPAHLLDRRIRALLSVRKGSEGIVRLNEGWRSSFFGWLAVARGWGQRIIQREIPPDESGVTMALLLGEGSTMTSEDWEKYIRTGVIHVLAISGQHLVVLAAFLWFLCRLMGIRRRSAAVFVALALIAYALLTGGRPSAMRAAVMVGVICAGILIRRPSLPANSFALAWIIVLALNPTDLFTAGFQLSFLCVAVLLWGIPRWFPHRELTPLEQLIDESRSPLERGLRAFGRIMVQWYLITLILMFATAPLILAWQNVMSPVGVLIGPPAILLTSIALVAGFLMLLVSPLGSWAMSPFAWITGRSIGACEWLVKIASDVPGGCWYSPAPPMWWLIIFYGCLFVWMFGARYTQSVSVDGFPVRRFVPIVSRGAMTTAICAWLCVGLLAGAWRPASDELRVSFVAVGHGCCVVVETPDGKVILYDAGSLSGPDVTRRHIAPYLWSRGISKIDDIFVSHADLDHFNGLPALADRFSIGQITLAPSFEQKQSPGVAFVLRDLRKRGIAIRETFAGERFKIGEVGFRILHPPPVGPEGPENARSLVMVVEHAGHRIMFTGDLELKGLAMVLDGPPEHVDVLMAPHHGSHTANTDDLAKWASPLLVIGCDGPKPPSREPDVYTKRKIPYWITWPHGTITLHSQRTALVAETYRTGQRVVLPPR